MVVGGPYATSLSQEVMEAGADFLVRGERETYDIASFWRLWN